MFVNAFPLFSCAAGGRVFALPSRLTDERPIPDESVKLEISNLIQLAATDSNLVLNIVYFVPDTRKAGGSYMEITGRVKKLIPHEKLLIMDTGTRIPVEDIVEVTVSSYVEKCRKKAY